jgi:hypothetical protein
MIHVECVGQGRASFGAEEKHETIPFQIIWITGQPQVLLALVVPGTDSAHFF